MVLEKNNIDTCLINLENKVSETLDKHTNNTNNTNHIKDVLIDINISDNEESVNKDNIKIIRNEDIDIVDNSSNMDYISDKDNENLDIDIDIDIEELKSNNDEINEIEIDIDIDDDDNDPLTLKRPDDVYYEIYKTAIDKAKHMRKVAVEAYLEAQQIKTKYMIIDDDEEENIIFKETD